MMKRKYIAGLMFSCLFCLSAGSGRAQNIPGIGNVSGLISRAIKAIDLKIQRLQNKTIGLQNAQKVIENAMTKLHLKEIAGWADRQKTLYEDYFRQLWKVKGVLTAYWKVKEIMQRQVRLVSEYRTTWRRLKTDSHFSLSELNQMSRVYSGILEESLRNLDQLLIACNALTTQMSDGKRMQLIVNAGDCIERNLTDLRRFNDRNIRMSLVRAVDMADRIITKKIYGIQ